MVPLLVLLVVGMSLAERAQASPLKGVERSKSPRQAARDRVEAEIWNARRFWAERGVAGAMDSPLSLEFDEAPQSAAGRGGFGRVRISSYWLAPNPWGMGRDAERALVHHEVRHALPGGERGGVDGQGHEARGLMGVPYEIPRELTTRSLRRKAAQRLMALRAPSAR